MARPQLFLTGGSGFVGARVLEVLERRGWPQVTTLARQPEGRSLPAGWTQLAGDVEQPEGWAGKIPEGSVVLHLAAVTGKAPKARYDAVNREGTRRLVEAAAAARVRGFVFVSSIAARYRQNRFAWYARSKAAAEAIVAGSGLPHLIARPTQVMGEGSPVAASLGRLANLPIPIVFGSGSVSVQPIDAAELAERLVDLLEGPFDGRIVELGGSVALTMRDLLTRLRRADLPRRAPVSIPLEPLRTLLGVAEPLLGRFLPFTAGQLSAFANDGAAEPRP